MHDKVHPSNLSLETSDDIIPYSQKRKAEVPIYFIPYHKFRNLQEFPRYPDNKNLCVDLKDVDFAESFVVFVSHCWLRGQPTNEGYYKRPHPDNASHEKFHLVKEAIPKIWGSYAPKMKSCYIWLDYGCINQDANPCAELKQLDIIIHHSDIILTPVSDKAFNEWNLDTTVDGAFLDYKAQSWQHYLTRAWCRIEMFYSAYVPPKTKEYAGRLERFSQSLQNAMKLGHRLHVIYGTKESRSNYWPEVLPPLTHSYLDTINPAEGSLSQESDKFKIVELMAELKPYIQEWAPQYGYRGGLNELNQRHGVGILRLYNGLCYEGDWKEDRCEGQCKIRWPNGNTYQGEVKNNKVTGQGTALMSNGVVQTGQWEDSVMHGYCCIEYSLGGFRYKGNANQGFPDGYAEVDINGSSVYKGQMQKGFFNLSDCNGCFYKSTVVCCLCFQGCRYKVCNCRHSWSYRDISNEEMGWESLAVGKNISI